MFDLIYLIVIFSFALIIGGLMLFFIDRNRKRRGLDVEKFRSKWLDIENSFDMNNPASYAMCIIKADTLLDLALKDLDVAGETMGERLKNSEGKISKIDSVWTAHKIRNKLVHEHDTKINPRITRQIMNTFKRALKDLGAI